MVETVEAVVVGAGPAGCAAAGLLSRWGHRVLLLDHPGAHEHALAVSIPPSARRTLQAVGFLTGFEAARLHPWCGNSVWWAGETPRVERFPPGAAGYHVVRADLHRLALQMARDAGVEVRAARARAVHPSDAPNTPSAVRLETPLGAGEVRADFVLDCSGRAGVIARDGLRAIEGAVRTVALTGIWHAAPKWDGFDDTHTLVASYVDGWAWSIPSACGVRYVTVMVDPQRTDLSRGDSAAAVYARELAKVPPFAALLAQGTLTGGPWGHDASLYFARQYAGPGWLLVGDAGSFIDPLSSFGVRKALASAWVAAVATHTALQKPELRDEALAFHDRRERDVYASYRRLAARFAAAVAARTPHAFWTARASQLDDDETVDEPDIARDGSVLAALEDLRRRDAIRLHRGAAVEVVRRPVIRGNEIALIDHLVLPDRPEGIRHLNGVDLVALADMAPQYPTVGDILDAHARSHAPLSLPALLAALSFLIARGVLAHGTS